MKLSLKKLANVKRIVGSILSASILMASLSCWNLITTINPTWFAVAFSSTFFLLTISHVIKCLTSPKKGIRKYKELIFSGIYLICAGFAIAFNWIDAFYLPIFMIYFGSVILNRVFNMIEDHRKRSIVFNILVIIVAVIIMLFVAAASLTFDAVAIFVAVIILSGTIALQAVIDVIFYAFSSIKFSILLNVIRKTYAAEILLGLILLIISFSFVFYIMEDEVTDYLDALWYSFAVVTTIGFGDVNVMGPVSRVLSVILGIYGIIVVAVLTSIIVNFYNETKDLKEENENKDEEPKEIEEEKKPEE